MRASFAIAPNFQSKGSWTDRLLVAEGNGWRAPHDDELAGLQQSASESATASACVFSIPAHLRARFWAMLNDEVSEGNLAGRLLEEIQ